MSSRLPLPPFLSSSLYLSPALFPSSKARFEFLDRFLSRPTLSPDRLLLLGRFSFRPVFQEREAKCNKWLKEHGVTPRVDWGTLPVEDQKLWTQYRCDEVVLESTAASGDSEPPAADEKQSRLLASEGNGDGEGAGPAAAAGGGQDRSGSGTAPRGGSEVTGGRYAAEDARDGKLEGELSGSGNADEEEVGAAARAGARAVR